LRRIEVKIIKQVFINEDNIWDYAEGIDFCPIFSDKVIVSYTKEEFKNVTAYPKTARRYWVIRNGKKTEINYGEFYIDDGGEIFQKL